MKVAMVEAVLVSRYGWIQQSQYHSKYGRKSEGNGKSV